MSIIKGWKFPIDVEKNTGKIQTIEDNDAIKQSVNIILKTEILERKIVKNFGCELRSFMFDIVNSNFVSSFKKTISTAIETWEDHVKIVDIVSSFSTGMVSKIEAQISYVTNLEPTLETIDISQNQEENTS